MSDYTKRIKEEAKTFYKSIRDAFAEDTDNFGGKSDKPNLAMWIDHKENLSRHVQEISAKWSHKDFLWVHSNTRNRNPKVGGDPRSNAFASFLQDVRHEIKKIAKAAKNR